MLVFDLWYLFGFGFALKLFGFAWHVVLCFWFAYLLFVACRCLRVFVLLRFFVWLVDLSVCLVLFLLRVLCWLFLLVFVGFGVVCFFGASR